MKVLLVSQKFVSYDSKKTGKHVEGYSLSCIRPGVKSNEAPYVCFEEWITSDSPLVPEVKKLIPGQLVQLHYEFIPGNTYGTLTSLIPDELAVEFDSILKKGD